MRFFPHPTMAASSHLRIHQLMVDGYRPSGNLVDNESRTVDLTATGSDDWRSSTFGVVLNAPADELDTVREEASDIRAGLRIECRRTNYRSTIELEPSQTDDAVWLGEGELFRAFCAGRVDVQAEFSGSRGDVEQLLLGQSDIWAIYVDQTEALPRRGMLRFVWIDFTGDEAPSPVQKFGNEIYYADLENTDGPVVYLNSSIGGLHDLLADRQNRDIWEQALHDTQRQAIAAPIWMGLFVAAAAAVEKDEETGEVESPPERWQVDVLKTLLPRMYETASDSERLSLLHDAVHSEEGAKGVAGLAQAAVAVQLRSATSLRRIVQRLDREVTS